MRSTRNAVLPVGRRCLGLTFRRLPSVASGKPQDGNSAVFNRAGSTLAAACFGLENGVHPTSTRPKRGDVVVLLRGGTLRL
jgi:hypothetical protein